MCAHRFSHRLQCERHLHRRGWGVHATQTHTHNRRHTHTHTHTHMSRHLIQFGQTRTTVWVEGVCVCVCLSRCICAYNNNCWLRLCRSVGRFLAMNALARDVGAGSFVGVFLSFCTTHTLTAKRRTTTGVV